ncbi:MAG: hypothetical protein WDM89_13160 [Rhizomicrobium sp.]
MIVAIITRKMTAAARPQKITLWRMSTGKRVAAMPITTALSPAITRSMMITCSSANTAPCAVSRSTS